MLGGAPQCGPLISALLSFFFFFSLVKPRKKKTSKGLFPDFQLRVHMHCPGQVLIPREMKRKKINSFYMNAQQAVLVCMCAG